MHPTWALAHAERAALATALTGLEAERWQTPALCGSWTVRGARTPHCSGQSGPVAWMRSVIGVRFDFDRHNALRLAEQLGNSSEETLERFCRVFDSTVATWGPRNARLGEIVVHGEDIRRPLGLPSPAPTPTAERLAWFYSRTEFAVVSRSRIRGLRLEATDAHLPSGTDRWCGGRSCRC